MAIMKKIEGECIRYADVVISIIYSYALYYDQCLCTYSHM